MYNIHNFRIRVPTWALLLVVLLAVGLATMGDLTLYGASILVNTIVTKAVPAMLTVCAAVFYSPSTNTTPGTDPKPVLTDFPEPVAPVPVPAPATPVPEAAA